ncbi:MAG TPA: type II toxin-antitoxin system VapC family toxin [bacterium]|nr:type II toxin-antitoxin system VapC family toxin [bacterium]
MSAYIIDASVAAKWYFPEDQHHLARRILVKVKFFRAPDIFLMEMDSIFCRRIKRKEMEIKDARQARTMLRRLPIRLYPFAPLLDSALEISIQTGSSIYDSLYLALASSAEGKLITADKRLFNTIHHGPFGNNIIWIEDFA